MMALYDHLRGPVCGAGGSLGGQCITAPAGLIAPKVFYDPRTFSLRPLMLGRPSPAFRISASTRFPPWLKTLINPELDIAIATVLVCLIQAMFCLATVYLAALVWPDFNSYPESETVILDIGKRAGGPWMMGFLTFILLVAGLASALTGQAGASRLLLGLCRDGVISRRIFGHVDPRYSTPARSVYLMGGSLAGRGSSLHTLSTGRGTAQFRSVRRIHPGEP